jgi:hypothetical protein
MDVETVFYRNGILVERVAFSGLIIRKTNFVLLLIVLFEGFKPRSSKDSLASINPAPGSARVKLTTFDNDAHIVLDPIRESSRVLRYVFFTIDQVSLAKPRCHALLT